jgi:hypothetical protein
MPSRRSTTKLIAALKRVQSHCAHGLDDFHNRRVSKACRTAIGKWARMHHARHRMVTRR